MATIEIKVNKELVEKVGLESVKEYLEKQLKLLKLQMLSKEIKTAIDESGLDIDKEFKNAKTEAWQEYKEKYLTIP